MWRISKWSNFYLWTLGNSPENPGLNPVCTNACVCIVRWVKNRDALRRAWENEKTAWKYLEFISVLFILWWEISVASFGFCKPCELCMVVFLLQERNSNWRIQMGAWGILEVMETRGSLGLTRWKVFSGDENTSAQIRRPRAREGEKGSRAKVVLRVGLAGLKCSSIGPMLRRRGWGGGTRCLAQAPWDIRGARVSDLSHTGAYWWRIDHPTVCDHHRALGCGTFAKLFYSPEIDRIAINVNHNIKG